MSKFTIYDGDPLLILTENGSRLEFKGGQPVMDQGWQNYVNISLFTRKGWCGNTLFEPNQQIGSDVELEAEKPITLQSLQTLRDEILEALKKNAAFNEIDVEVSVTNPSGYQRDILIEIKPPGQDIQQFIFTKNGLNWLGQSINPAYKRI